MHETTTVEPIELGPGTHLFVDDYLVADSKGLVRTTHQAERSPHPILAKAEPWHEQPMFQLEVIPDPERPGWRMWYSIKNPGGGGAYRCFGYAESPDGIEWKRPHLGLVEAGGSTANNLIPLPDTFGLFLVDDGPDCPEPSQRYKLGYYGGGLAVAFSADGRHFDFHPGNPVLSGTAKYPQAEVSDVIDGCWDPLRRCYLLIHKASGFPEDGYRGKPPHNSEGHRRVVAQSLSDDFVHWREPRRIIEPGPEEPGMWEFYGMMPQVRGDLYLGFLRVLRDDLPAEPGGTVEGIGWTELCTSRDGENWTHHREPFLQRSDQPGAWDRAMAWVGDCETVGDEELVYYGGWSTGHKGGDRQIGLAKLRKNGFVSRDAGSEQGALCTPVVVLQAEQLVLNATVQGELQVRVLDRHGHPLEGLDWDECDPIHGDSLAHTVRWKRGPAPPRGRPVRLEFSLREAQLYGFDLVA